jgi:hypothetical protein
MNVEIELRDGGVFLAGTTTAVPCQWFVLCDRDAVTVTPHPLIGAVPCCQRCHDAATA